MYNNTTVCIVQYNDMYNNTIPAAVALADQLGAPLPKCSIV